MYRHDFLPRGRNLHFLRDVRLNHLDHIVEDEVGEDGEGVGANVQGIVVEPGVHLRGPRLNSIREPNEIM